MLWDPSRVGFGVARLTTVGATLLHAAVAPTVSLASAATGAAVALHFAAAPRTGEYLPRPGRAVTSVEKSVVMAAPPPPTVPARITAGAENVSDRSGATPTAWVATAASRPISERELTFAWGYAQRHAGAAARTAEALGPLALATARAQKAASVSKRQPQRQPERRRASGAQRATVGLVPSRSLAGVDSDPHQTLDYTEQRYANGLRVFSDGQSAPNPHQRKSSPPPHT
jgi:hypothetical protein